MSIERIRAHFTEAHAVLTEFLSDERNLELIASAGKLMTETLRNGGKIMSCGNGGSHCDAMHFAEELTGRYRDNRRALAAMAISDVSHISCVGNDYGYDQIFSRYIEGLGQANDVLLAISTSGNSKNVLLAIEAARNKGMKVVGLTGKDGGAMGGLCDVEIRAPKSQYADRVQEIHIKVIHALIDDIENNII
jgi:D-sedoheptulose 7-phosphate isomerase